MNDIEFNASVATMMAHSMVYETKQELSPNGIVDDAVNGDPPAPTVQESASSVNRAFIDNFSDYIGVQLAEIPNLEQALLDVTKNFTPQFNEANLKNFEEFTPRFNAAGQKIINQNAIAQAEGELDVLQGPGTDLVRAARELRRENDPELFQAREAGLENLLNLFGEIGASGDLSGGERAEIERGLAAQDTQRGTQNAPSSSEAVGSAMTFGGAQQQREAQSRTEMNEVLNTASSFMNSSRSGVDPFQVATGRPSTNNQGAGQFKSRESDPSQIFQSGSAMNSGNQQIAQNSANINANRRSGLDVGLGAVSSVAGSIGSL